MISEAALVEAVKRARAKGEKVLRTNGCFDILHAGHGRSYMNHAAELGDRLIAAFSLIRNDSVKRLKGPVVL